MTVRLTPFWHGSRVSARNLVLITVIAVAALLCGIGIGKNPFWDDEAETALVARGIVEYGSRSAWTGENVVAFRGGFDLDDHLVQVSVPPLQYYLTAASFLVFGEGTVSGRFPFLLAGILTLWLVHRWTATYLGPDFPSWLPSLLLALNVPFLLFIAQCRYYALVMMFTAALLWGWAEIGRHARPALICVGGGAAIVGLFEANYMDAAALAVACAVGSLQSSPQRRRNLLFLTVIGFCLAPCIGDLLMRRATLTAWSTLRGTMPPIPHLAILTRWELQGLGTFEFFPVFIIPMLFLPWLFDSLQQYRSLALRASFVLLMIPAALLTIAALSPQDVAVTHVADMRYATPVIILGSLVTSTAIVITAAAGGRVVAAVLTCLIVLTNAFYLGGPRLQCTLCERLNELAGTHPSGTAAMLQAASDLQPKTSVAVFPAYMVRPMMFYRPDLRYPDLLDPQKVIVPEIRAALPYWVFCCSTAPDVMLVGIGSVDALTELPTNGHKYVRERTIKSAWLDQTRPELPWHAFHPDFASDESCGVVVLRREPSN
jgi:4-amino-4-deoxy-L-arabinose transferase-like glycosyltransferase